MLHYFNTREDEVNCKISPEGKPLLEQAAKKSVDLRKCGQLTSDNLARCAVALHRVCAPISVCRVGP